METESPEVIECYLPDDPSISAFHSLQQHMKVRVIRLGLRFIEDGEHHLQLWNDEEWEAKLTTAEDIRQREVARLSLQLEQAQEDIASMRTRYEEQHSQVVRQVLETERQRHAGELDALKTNNAELLTRLQKLHDELEVKYNKRCDELRANNDKRLSNLSVQMQEMREEYEAKLARRQNSTLKGKDGEEFVLGRLNMLFPTADIEDTHSLPHRGDFILRDDDMTMMIETKNYSRNVQKAEIDKFYRDIENPANSDIQCAIFVSLHTGICSREDFDFEMHNGIPVLFIHRLCDNFDSITLAMKFFKVVVGQSAIDLSSKEIVDNLKRVAATIKRNFNRQKLILDKYHSEQSQLLAQQQSNVIDLYTVLDVKY